MLALLARHRAEKKETQARIQALKKTATKGDKKKKKEVTEAITKLEDELSNRHRQELEDLEATEASQTKCERYTTTVDKNIFLCVCDE